jgi:hypothetical protein
MSRIIRLTENDLARIVRRVIMEEPSLPQPLTLPQPLKTALYKDQAATKIETNIDVDSSSIKLIGDDVWFDFNVAGMDVPSSGYFKCSTNNQVSSLDYKFPEKFYLSLKKRAWIFKSKCGKAQGYVNTNTVVDTNLS